jgi:hypothetical protein
MLREASCMLKFEVSLAAQNQISIEISEKTKKKKTSFFQGNILEFQNILPIYIQYHVKSLVSVVI